MVRGRKPLSLEQKQARGAADRNKQRNKTTPIAKRGYPEPTDLVKENAVACRRWHAICKDLDELNVLSVADKHLLEMHCIDYSQYVHLLMVVQGGNISCSDDNGKESVSPEEKQFQKYRDAMLKQLIELGLTPSARARLHVKQEEEADEFVEWLSGGGVDN